MCRNAASARKKIHALTASPASGAATNAAASAKGNKRMKRKIQNINQRSYRNCMPLYIKDHLRTRVKIVKMSYGVYGCATPAFAPENGGQDYHQQGYQSHVDGLPAVTALQGTGRK
jgi:hypothetical protein